MYYAQEILMRSSDYHTLKYVTIATRHSFYRINKVYTCKLFNQSYGKMMIHLAHTLYVRCHAPITYIKPYHLYGVLWWPGGHKRTKSFLTLFNYRPKLTFYDQNMKATSSYFILKQSLSPSMKHKYLLFLSMNCVV